MTQLLGRIIPLLFLGFLFAGCLGEERILVNDVGVWLDLLNAGPGSYKASYELQEGGVGFEEFKPYKGGFGGSFDCARNPSSYTGTTWIRITLREPEGSESFGSQPIGPVVFVGNWTGLTCGHHYIFRLLDDDFTWEAYEEVHYLKRPHWWNPNEHEFSRRGNDLERVPN